MIKNFGRFKSKAEGYDHIAKFHAVEINKRPQEILPLLALTSEKESKETIYQFILESDSTCVNTIFRLKYSPLF